MNVSNLFRFLLARSLCLGIVDGEEGGADDEDQDDGADEQDGDEDTDGSDDDQAEEDDDGADEDDGDDDEEEGDDTEGSDDLVVTLGGEEPSDEDKRGAPEWVRELRKSNRAKDRELREKDAEIARLKGGTSQPAAVAVGEKPTLEGCDFDAEKFERELDAWKDRKHAAEDAKRQKDEAETKGREAWQKTTEAYNTAKTALKLPDFEDAEATVQDELNTTQQGIVLHLLPPKKAALLVYALAKNPKKLAELKAINDPVHFAGAVKELELKMKVTNKKAAPAPERVVRSNVSGAAAVDKPIERARADARKSGDYSKVMELRRQNDAKKQKQRA